VPFNGNASYPVQFGLERGGGAVIPLEIQYIDISQANDASPGGDILIVTQTAVWIKTSSSPLTDYTLLDVTGGPANGSPITPLTPPLPVLFYYDVIHNLGATGASPTCPYSAGHPLECPASANVLYPAPYQSSNSVLMALWD